MKVLSVAAAAVAMFVGGQAFAQSTKSGVQIGDMSLLDSVSAAGTASTNGNWQTVLKTSLHTSALKDIVVGVSLEAGLFTDTTVSSSKGTRDASKAEAQIEVRVVIDKGTNLERVAAPGEVIFARRSQELIAQFGGILQSCTDSNADGTITLAECTFTNETLQLILETVNANAFFFALNDLGSGSHTVTVEARMSTSTSVQSGAANARAFVGKGALTVEEVRLAKDGGLVL